MLVTKMFRDHIGKSIKVYVDDMKLNAAKYSFRASSWKFIGFLVNYRGLEANPKKIEALRNIRAPTIVNEMQKLAGMIAAFKIFIFKCSDKCHHFFQALKGGKQLKWIEEWEEALANLKEYLASPPLISIPQPHEQLYLYLSVFLKVVSATLIREEDMV